MCPLQSIPVTYTRDRYAYVVDLTLYTVESTAFGRQGPEVRIFSPRPIQIQKLDPLTTFNSLKKFRYRARIDGKVGEAFPRRIFIALGAFDIAKFEARRRAETTQGIDVGAWQQFDETGAGPAEDQIGETTSVRRDDDVGIGERDDLFGKAEMAKL